MIHIKILFKHVRTYTCITLWDPPPLSKKNPFKKKFICVCVCVVVVSLFTASTLLTIESFEVLLRFVAFGSNW